ncbi:hypothetical protein [Streptomyces sp. NPDC101150]
MATKSASLSTNDSTARGIGAAGLAVGALGLITAGLAIVHSRTTCR